MLLSSKDILLLRLDVNLVKQTDLLQTGTYDKLPTFTTYQKIVYVEIVVVNSFLMGFFHVTASVPITQASLYKWWQLNCHQIWPQKWHKQSSVSSMEFQCTYGEWKI